MANDITIRLAVAGMARVDAELAKLKQSISSAFSSIGSTVAAVTGIGGGLGLAGLITGGALGVKEITELGGKMKDLSTQTGASVEKLMAIRTALQDSGVSADSVGMVFAKMQKAISEAADVGGPAAEALQKIGLNIEALTKMDPASQFEAVGAAMAKLPTATERTATAMKLFGKSGAELIPFFSDGGALTDAEKTLGRLPHLLAINAELFDAISDGIGHVKIKAQQFFAGFANIIGDDLLGIVKSIDGMDFSYPGERFGAFILEIKKAWADGTIASLISLSFQAGFEQAEIFGAKSWKAITDGIKQHSIGEAIWIGFMETMSAILKAATVGIGDLLAVLGAAFNYSFAKIADGLTEIFDGIVNLWGSAINGLLSGFETVINKIRSGLTMIDGVKRDEFKVGIEFKSSPSEKNNLTFESALTEMKDATDSISESVKEWINSGMDGQRKMFASSAASNGSLGQNGSSAMTATDRLGAILRDLIAKVNAGKPEPYGPPNPPPGDDHAKFDIMKAEAELKQKLLALSEKLNDVESDFSKTEFEKFAQKRQILQEEAEELKAGIEKIHEAMLATQDRTEKEKLLNEELRIRGELNGVVKQDHRLGPDPNSFSEQWTDAFKKVREAWGTTAQNIASVGKSALGATTKFMADGLDNMIWKTGSLRDLWLGFAHTLTSSVTQALANMFMQWIMGDNAKSAVTKSNAAGEAAAKAPGTLMDSIASFGIAAAVGGAAFLAVMALTGGFREQGGPVEAGKSYIVGERRPEVFVPSVPGHIVPSVKEFVDGQSITAAPAPMQMPQNASALMSFELPTPTAASAPRWAGPAASVSPGGSGAGGDQKPYHIVAVVDGEAAAKRYLDSKGGRGHIVRISRQESLEVGNVG